MSPRDFGPTPLKVPLLPRKWNIKHPRVSLVTIARMKEMKSKVRMT